MKKLIAILLIAAVIAGIIILWPVISSVGQTPTASEAPDQSGIVLSEVMTSNKGIYTDDTGSSSDWVEVYNSTDQAVDLSHFGLSDDMTDPVKWAFPELKLAPHGYAIVFLTGDSKSDTKNGIIHCSFKLSAQGETLILSNSSGHMVDSVDIPALSSNVSYGRIDDKWQILSAISPGYENSDAGIAAYKESLMVKDPALRINEVMASNAMTIKDPEGEYSDWVEITNISDADYSLGGCGLSDNAGAPMKWTFPDITLKPGETLLIYCSGRSSVSAEGPLEASFKLSSYNSTVLLSDKSGRLLDSVTYSDMASDWSYARGYASGAPTDSWALTSLPTPGYPNTDDGFTAFIKANPAPESSVVISEVLCSNNTIKFGDAQTSSDFIEIENRGGEAVNLAGYGLTDNAGNPAKYRFPDKTLQPGERVTVLAAGVEAAADTQNLSAPFKLSRLGATVALFDANDQLLDRYFIGSVPQNISVGHKEGSTEIAYFETPTPGAANGDGKSGIAPSVQFSQAPGKYDGAVQLTLTASDGFDIYYTTADGITPSPSATKYTGPITVSETASVRARAYKQDYIPSGTTTATYFIGTSHTLPVISITTDKPNLFDPTTGIYMLGPNPGSAEAYYPTANFRSDTEVPASFAMYDENGQQVFQQNIGLAMTGGLTLGLREQKSFAIYARSQYGESTMAYPFFDNRKFTEYKSLVLRQGGRDTSKTKLNTYVSLGLVDGQMNVETQAAKPCVVYINGEYWGVYFLMEKRNKYMVSQHEGITDESVTDAINLVKGSGGVVNNGSNEGYLEIYNYIKSHDMSVKENYDWVAARFDTDSFMDFIINEIYIANNDPGNMQYYQVPPDGLWRQIYQDLDNAFYSFDTLALRMDSATTGSDIFNGLLKYQPWRDAFIKRFAWAMKNIYNPDRVTAMIDEAADAIRGEVAADHERWSELPTLEEWESGVQAMKSFAQKRPAAMVGYLKQHFSLTQDQIDMLNEAAK
jgi:hypothetical protein